jgi:hypothetical protein
VPTRGGLDARRARDDYGFDVSRQRLVSGRQAAVTGLGRAARNGLFEIVFLAAFVDALGPPLHPLVVVTTLLFGVIKGANFVISDPWDVPAGIAVMFVGIALGSTWLPRSAGRRSDPRTRRRRWS